MIKTNSVLLAASLAAIAFSTPASAQDFSLEPTYGSVELEVGFLPDPVTVDLLSGGSIDANNLGEPCRGYIANAPDFRLFYSAGNSPLYISAASQSDVTLVVNMPDGSWWCDDDSGEGLNPSILFNNPQSGQYDIWVGTYGSTSLENARLSISELYSE